MKMRLKPYYNKSDRKSLLGLIVVAAVGLAVVVFMGNDNRLASGLRETAVLSDDRGSSVKSVSDAGSGEAGCVKSVPGIENGRFHRQNDSCYWQDGEYYAVECRKTELFFFDPNTADSTALLRLGLQPWQVRNIYKYRAKGGIYRKASDFARLYGLTVAQYKALKPYIRISPDYNPASTLVEAERYVRDTVRYPVKIGESERIVLNSSDTSQLKRVPGIGSGFARAIVDYRERLGGYLSIDQLDEIDGFPSESKRFFIIGSQDVAKLNVNKSTLTRLKRHPYIGYFRAKAIVDYRRLHGTLSSIDDLSLHRDFTEDAIKRLKPYIEY